MNEIDSIADLYFKRVNAPVVLTEVVNGPNVDVYEPEKTIDITTINVYIKPAQGAIQRPYTGAVTNVTELDSSTTLIAVDQDNDKTIQVIMTGDENITVTVLDAQGNVQDTFMGKNLDFYDMDSEQKELNIIKIENV